MNICLTITINHSAQYSDLGKPLFLEIKQTLRNEENHAMKKILTSSVFIYLGRNAQHL